MLRRHEWRRWPMCWRDADDDPALEQRAGLAGDRPHGHAQGLRRPGAAGARDVEAQSAQWAPVRVPWPARLSDQGAMARRPGHVPVREAAGARAFHLAIFRERSGDDHAGATGIFAGGNRLADAATHVASTSSRLNGDKRRDRLTHVANGARDASAIVLASPA